MAKYQVLMYLQLQLIQKILLLTITVPLDTYINIFVNKLQKLFQNTIEDGKILLLSIHSQSLYLESDGQ